MDSRLDVFAALGLGDGEAHVLRNAGGTITDDVIRSLALSQRRLGTREVMLIHHTDRGMEKITDEGFREELEDAAGTAPATDTPPPASRSAVTATSGMTASASAVVALVTAWSAVVRPATARSDPRPPSATVTPTAARIRAARPRR